MQEVSPDKWLSLGRPYQVPGGTQRLPESVEYVWGAFTTPWNTEAPQLIGLAGLGPTRSQVDSKDVQLVGVCCADLQLTPHGASKLPSSIINF